MTQDSSRLQRPLQPVPEDVRLVLNERSLIDDYEARPAYQRNDYLGWVARARNPETRAKRLAQMLNELERGGVYMNMQHAASRKS